MSNSRSFETVVDLDGVEVEVEVTYRYSPGHEGRLYGLPEDCEPPEGAECEVEAVTLKGDRTRADIMPRLKPDVVEMLFEHACNAGENSDGDAYEAAMEDKADAMREREAFED